MSQQSTPTRSSLSCPSAGDGAAGHCCSSSSTCIGRATTGRVVTVAVGLGLVLLIVLIVAIRSAVRHRPAASGAQEVFGGAYVRDSLTALLDLADAVDRAADDPLRTGLPAAARAARGRVQRRRSCSRSAAACSSPARATCCCSSWRSSCSSCRATCSPGYAKRDGLSTEGAIKYFLLGSFSSAIFLFGLVLTFGYTGTTSIREVAGVVDAASSAPAASRRSRPALLMGLALLTTGVAFKIAAVPFHYWTPDAYQGSPTPVTGYLSVGPQGRRLRAHPAPLRRRRSAPLKADWTPCHRRPGRADDDARQPRRADPGQHQAHAGLQLDRPHRLHPGRPRRLRRRAGRLARRGGRPAGGPVLRGRLRVHEPGRVRRRRRAPAPAGRDEPDRDLRRVSAGARRC